LLLCFLNNNERLATENDYFFNTILTVIYKGMYGKFNS